MKPLQTSRSSGPNAGDGHRHRFSDFFVTGVFCIEVQHFNELTTTSRQLLDGIANELLLLGHDLNLLKVSRWIERLLDILLRTGPYGEAFGSVLVSPAAMMSVTSPQPTKPTVSSGPRPSRVGSYATSETLAVTLVHEFQHGILSALLHLIRLTEDDDGSLYHVPWRDTPRAAVRTVAGRYVDERVPVGLDEQ